MIPCSPFIKENQRGQLFLKYQISHYSLQYHIMNWLPQTKDTNYLNLNASHSGNKSGGEHVFLFHWQKWLVCVCVCVFVSTKSKLERDPPIWGRGSEGRVWAMEPHGLKFVSWLQHTRTSWVTCGLEAIHINCSVLGWDSKNGELSQF